MRKTRKYGLLLVAIVAIALLVWWYIPRLGSGPRRQWKNQAIAQIQERLSDPDWAGREAAPLRKATSSRPSYQGEWVGDELLLMQNGDWIVYRNICQKSNARIPDLFIGRGSDGKWYYSTFHFCVGACVLHIEPQPASLADFVDMYWLIPFDGNSDDCLKTTWDGGPYGLDRKLATQPSPATP